MMISWKYQYQHAMTDIMWSPGKTKCNRGGFKVQHFRWLPWNYHLLILIYLFFKERANKINFQEQIIIYKRKGKLVTCFDYFGSFSLKLGYRSQWNSYNTPYIVWCQYHILSLNIFGTIVLYFTLWIHLCIPLLTTSYQK